MANKLLQYSSLKPRIVFPHPLYEKYTQQIRSTHTSCTVHAYFHPGSTFQAQHCSMYSTSTVPSGRPMQQPLLQRTKQEIPFLFPLKIFLPSQIRRKRGKKRQREREKKIIFSVSPLLLVFFRLPCGQWTAFS